MPASGLEVADGVRLVPATGHTPGHPSVRPAGTGLTALVGGDSVHHPVQLARPDTGGVGGVDPARARNTRRRLLVEPAGTDDLLLGTRFTHPTGGRVQQRNSRFPLVPPPPVRPAPDPFAGRRQGPGGAW